MAKKYIDAELLRKEIERLKTENNNIRCTANGSYCVGYDDAFGDLLSTINSLQQEQHEVDLEDKVTFDCISKKVTMTVRELINYYIDRECCDVADECGF